MLEEIVTNNNMYLKNYERQCKAPIYYLPNYRTNDTRSDNAKNDYRVYLSFIIAGASRWSLILSSAICTPTVVVFTLTSGFPMKWLTIGIYSIGWTLEVPTLNICQRLYLRSFSNSLWRINYCTTQLLGRMFIAISLINWRPYNSLWDSFQIRPVYFKNR